MDNDPTEHPEHPCPAGPRHRYLHSGVWDGRTLFEALVDSANQRPHHQALVDGGRQWSYADLVLEVEKIAEGLREHLDSGDRLIVQLPNQAEAVLTTLACFACGIIPIWTLPQHREHELTAFAEHCEARAIVTVPTHRDIDLESLAHSVRDRVSTLEHVIIVGLARRADSVPFTDLAKVAERSLSLVQGPTDACQIAVLIPSGGTTGASKIVPRTHNDLGFMLRAAVQACRFDHTSRYLVVLPVGHGFANTGPGVLGTLVAGGTVIMCPSTAPETALRLAVRHRATATSVVPAILSRWVDYLRANKLDVPSLTLVQSGAARLAPELAAAAEGLLKCTVQQVYGMSEGLTCVTRIDDPPEARWNTQGWPLSEYDEIRVLDENGCDLPPGVPGILATRGPYTVHGYYRSPEADRRAFLEGGWYLTDDLAVLRHDGRILVNGRAGDTINRGGEKVSAIEVEELIRPLIGVTDCAVVAMPNAIYGEEVCVFVTTSGRTLAVTDLKTHLLGAGLADYKAPKYVFQVSKIPLTGIGKVDRPTLRAIAAQWAQDHLAAVKRSEPDFCSVTGVAD